MPRPCAEAEAYLGRGNVALKEGRTDEALTEYREVLKLTPALAEAPANCSAVCTADDESSGTG